MMSAKPLLSALFVQKKNHLLLFYEFFSCEILQV